MHRSDQPFITQSMRWRRTREKGFILSGARASCLIITALLVVAGRVTAATERQFNLLLCSILFFRQ